MTLVSEILTAGITRSFVNRPDVLATSAAELVRLVDRQQRKAFAIAARLNPTFFATSTPVTFSGAGWARPSSAETVFWITQGGAEVAIVPFLEQDAETGLTVYEVGGQFRPAAGSLIDTSAVLTVWYSRQPSAVSGLTDPLDSQWPDASNDLLIVPVAAYLAQKDGRAGEVEALKQEFIEALQLYVAFLEHATSGVRARSMIPKAVPGQGLAIAKGLLGLA